MTDLENNFNVMEKVISDEVLKSPLFTLSVFAGAGLLIGFFGIQKIIKAGIWLKSAKEVL